MIVEMAIFGVLNRARGSHLFELTTSTELGRVVATGGMALLLGWHYSSFAILLWVWAALLLWCEPGWDKYWSEEIGHSATHDRLYGLMQMTARQLLILPCVLGIGAIAGWSWWMLLVVLLGLPYYVFGYVSERYAIPASEYAVGALLWLILGGGYV